MSLNQLCCLVVHTVIITVIFMLSLYCLDCRQGGKTEGMFLDMYDAAMDGMEKYLLKRTNVTNLLMLSDWTGARNNLKMDHLACFVPGMLALGAWHSYVSCVFFLASLC